MNKVLKELGFLAKTPVTYEETIATIEKFSNGHFDSALFHIENIYKTLEVPVNVLLDFAFGIDVFFEDEEGNAIGLDITVNDSVNTYNHKCNVQRKTKQAAKELGIDKHLIVYINSSKTYRQLTEDDKWNIIDTLNDAVKKGLDDISISI